MQLNVSEVLDLDLCPEYRRLRWDVGRVPARDEAPALRRGTHVHTVLEQMMRGVPPERIPEMAVQEALGGILPAAERAVHLALKAWWARYGLFHPWTRVIETEKALSTRITVEDQEVELVGTPDAVVEWEGKLWHVQHKSVGQSKSVAAFVSYVAVSLHEALYAALIREAYPEVPYGGTMLNVVRAMSEKRMLENPDQALHLEFVSVTEKAMSEGILDIRLAARQILVDQIVPRAVRVYRRRKSCTGQYGQAECGYYGVCWRGEDITGPAFQDYDAHARYAEVGPPDDPEI